MGLYYLNPDDGFAWSDGSPVSNLIFCISCASHLCVVYVFLRNFMFHHNPLYLALFRKANEWQFHGLIFLAKT